MIKHDNVSDAGVIGVPDEIAGEVPKAFVVLKTPIEKQKLLDYVNGRLFIYSFIFRISVSPSCYVYNRLLHVFSFFYTRSDRFWKI